MSDEANAGAQPAGDTTASAATTDAGAAPAAGSEAASTAPPSAREALNKAFESTGLFKPEEGKPAADRTASPVAAKAAGDGKTAAELAADRGDGRTARGQFAPKKAGDAAAPDPLKAADPTKGETGEQQQAAITTATPPPGWSIKSKAQWDKLPAEVRADIAKREAEVSAGFSEYAGVKPYAERARQGGQTLAQALQAYTGIEDLFRRDPAAGFMHVASNTGLTQHQAGALFAQLAQQLGFQFNGHAPGDQNAPGGSPADQNAGADPAALNQLFAPMVQPLAQRLHQIEHLLSGQAEAHRSQRLTNAGQVVETFRADPAHRYYANVEETIGDLLESGVVKRTGDLAADLAKAYELACRHHPEIHELLINEQVAEKVRTAQQQQTAQKAALSITGAPASGNSSAASSPPPTARDALKNAFTQVGL